LSVVLPVDCPDPKEVRLQFRLHFLRQHRDPILPAFPIPHHNPVERKIDILNSQAQTFEQPHARAEK